MHLAWSRPQTKDTGENRSPRRRAALQAVGRRFESDPPALKLISASRPTADETLGLRHVVMFPRLPAAALLASEGTACI